ncbi:MAG: tryptophan-rich sensory protein [Gemmatimonadaceae bacterium]|nr:tryptophan-rich sensory protein [Acetobacteraceae bacterium]
MIGRRLQPVAIAALSAMAVAALGASATDIGPWYQSLQKPWFQPPDWLFGPAWTLIYGLIALSGVKAWNAARDRDHGLRITAVYALNALFNIAWTELFFRLQRPDWALAEVVLFWLSIVLLIVVASSVSHAAGWLLVPYLVWVTFAGVLNLAVVRLNPVSAGY